ncbi:ubiquitin-protein ligase [Trypanosoma conorhini]|uniref:HECT-type E3 ubiquitin transferase n=1 Tax=Trypanosoma conorhini TaxID=83891 RepID=A0A3R7P8X0_9TRYP|nr:ubiquitin-protein ligase [Trypanosoma conorhini]RNF14664.1 ubiquitin-protein ligase [Trypanosoma conorhini]
MSAADGSAGLMQREEAASLVGDLKSALAAFKRSQSDGKSQRLFMALDRVCVAFCFGDEEFVRRLEVERYAAELVSTLKTVSQKDFARLRSLVVQALALLADIVPRGGLAVATAKGVPPLLCLLNDVAPPGNEALLEEVLKCISHVSLEAHTAVVQANAVSVIASLEAKVEAHPLRMMCLKCLCHLLGAARLKDWNKYLLVPCNALAVRFSQQARQLVGDAKDPAAERFSKENGAYMLRLIECVALIYDRILRSREQLLKNSSILEHSVPAFVTVLVGTVSMGAQGSTLRDAVCSPLLTLFFTDPMIAVKMFLKYYVLHSVCKILSALAERRTKLFSHSGVGLAEALLQNDASVIPFMAEEQQIIHLLEFLLVVTPAAILARESDYYVTLPHFIWHCEDDFHNRNDCSDSLSRQLEGEYEIQRRCKAFTQYEISYGTRVLKVDFSDMQYVSNDLSSYPHGFGRYAFLSGYIHRRPMFCNCGEDALVDAAIIPQHQGSCLAEAPNRGTRCSQNPLVSRPTRGNDAVNAEIFPVIVLQGTEVPSSLNMPHTSRLKETATERVVNEKEGAFCCVLLPRFWKKRGRNAAGVRQRNERNSKKYLFTRENFSHTREGLLRDPATRVHFLQDAMIQMIVSSCLPVLESVVKETVSPVVARHCSILILRCIDLTVEYFRMGSTCLHPKNKEDLFARFNLLRSRLGTVLSYLATTNTTQSLTAYVQPFKENQSNQPVLRALTLLGFTQHSRLPAMTLRCEIQMSALSSLLILQHAYRVGMSVFNNNQKLFLRRMLETLTDRVSRHQGVLRSSLHGSTGAAPCPFHGTPEKLEGTYAKLLEQVILILSLDLPKTCKGPGGALLKNSRAPSPDSSILNIDSTNPLEFSSVLGTAEESRFSEGGILSDIMMRASRHVNLNTGLQQVLAIHEYMLESEDNLASLVHEHPEFLEQLASELQNSVTQTVLNAELVKAFSQVREGLLRLINQNLGLVNVEEVSPIERQPARLERRFRRNKVMLAMTNYMWSPLRVKLEPLEFTGKAGQPPSAARSLFIAGEKYTLLDICLARESVSVLPTTSLSHLAKQILFQLQHQYADTAKFRQDVKLGRRHSAPESIDIQDLYSLTAPPIPMPEVDEGEDVRSLSFQSFTHMDLHAAEVPETAGSSRTTAPLLSRESTYASERALRAAALTTVTSAHQGQTRRRTFCFGEPSSSDTAEEAMYTISINNIVFFCNGTPVTDLSVSVLELLWKDATKPVDGTAAATDEMQCGGELGATSGVQRVMALWSTAHTIQYVIVKEPFLQGVDDVTEESAYDKEMSSPRKLFTHLLRYAGTRSSLKFAAKLLNELRRVLLVAKVPVNYAEGRLCSALIYGFYNYLGVFMLPPLLWFPLLCSSLNEQRDQHLASYILWNFPSVFSLSIRRALLQLLFSVRRLPTTVTSKLKEALRGATWPLPIHGLEWVTPELNMHGTKKVVVQRDNLLVSGSIVLRTHAMCPLPLSVEFENENGVGAGPAREFYNLFAAQLQELRLNMWRSEQFMDNTGALATRVQVPLFPAVCQTAKSLAYFELLGLLVGRVLLEERVVELPLHRCFTQGIVGNLDKNRLHDIDPELDLHLTWLGSLSEERLLDCDLTFVLPISDAATAGEAIELCPNGSVTRVSRANVFDYITAVRQYYTRKVLLRPLMHFRQGLRYAVIPSYLELFSVEELQLLISGPDGKIWEKPEDLGRIISAAHGYNRNSPVVAFLLEVVSGWDAALQRAFLRFVTGSSRLPLGGLRPPITVVRRTLGVAAEAEGRGVFSNNSFGEETVGSLQMRMDASLPTVNTCAHYLKLPSYSSKALLQEKLRTAVTEGQECFLLT